MKGFAFFSIADVATDVKADCGDRHRGLLKSCRIAIGARQNQRYRRRRLRVEVPNLKPQGLILVLDLVPAALKNRPVLHILEKGVPFVCNIHRRGSG